MNYKAIRDEIEAIQKGEKAAAKVSRVEFDESGNPIHTDVDPEKDRAQRAARLSQALPARQKSGMTQTAFARWVGVSQTTVANWEQGKKPTGAAKRLLFILEKHPELIKEVG